MKLLCLTLTSFLLCHDTVGLYWGKPLGARGVTILKLCLSWIQFHGMLKAILLSFVLFQIYIYIYNTI